MGVSKRLLAGGLCAAALVSPGCQSADLIDLYVQLLVLAVVGPVFSGAPPGNQGKSASIPVNYVVHYIEVDEPSRTCSFYASAQFEESTPLTFGYKVNKKRTKFKVDKKAPMPTTATFVKERLEELSDETFTVNAAKVKGKGKNLSATEFPVTLTVNYTATVDTGTLAGTPFKGKFVFKGNLGDWAKR